MAPLPHYPNWMHYVNGNKKLSDLTIPGTHDSGTWTLGLSYQCQTMTLAAQLHSGIRFLDIRLKPSGDNDKLQVWHGGGGETGLQFTEDIVDVCRAFLHENPSETLIMSIKDESQTFVREEDFYKRLWGDIQSYGGLFFTEDRVPQLCEVRGTLSAIFRQHSKKVT